MKALLKALCIAFCLVCMMLGTGFAQASGEQMVWYRVYLGMGIGKAQVSADVIRDFLAREVTPRFPHGFSVINARGQWSSPTNGLIRENNTIVDLQCQDTAEEKAKITAITEAYANRFKKAKASIFVVRVPGISTEFKTTPQ